MEHSEFIARMMGPFLVAVSAVVLLRRKLFLNIAQNFTKNYGFIFLAGLFTFLAGLLLIEFHNVWVFGWQVVITLFGWLALVGGLFRIFFPDVIEKIRIRYESNQAFMMINAFFALLLGLFLTVMGYR